ncbi:hypothetical protein KFL_005350030 [Klebsormidium nitens]|uniref:Hypervirulence associated protein TUDOR domain-containing protein n=1 Tax=Klebsormidium nitens TaxID=105231 RepID=A0A1Y1IN57_KLENI|nr:hypothetical protein KFL_005350030 [Klebsormidium nitens]|eukprot:GAQ89548.1 hypothetical protein KFL_005350030 [Klebsormidium nitens]
MSQQSQPELQEGEKVAWKFGAGKAVGHVDHKLTEPTKVGSRTYKASEENPKYLVQSDKSGGKAAHNPDKLEKLED